LVWVALVAVLATVAVAATASAQGQTVHVSVEDAVVTDTPDELPGMYEVAMVVEARPTGGMCLCTETAVELETTQPSGVDAVLTPSAYAIQWLGQHQGEHTEEVRASFDVPAEYANESMVRVTIDGHASANAPAVDGEFYPADVALPIPDADEEAQVEESSQEGNDTGAAANESAQAHAADASAGSLGGSALATGAGFAGLALVGVAARRFRG
jgi:hypothetical protein